MHWTCLDTIHFSGYFWVLRGDNFTNNNATATKLHSLLEDIILQHETSKNWGTGVSYGPVVKLTPGSDKKWYARVRQNKICIDNGFQNCTMGGWVVFFEVF